jgi:trehalose 6-phosphate phosphatase
MVATRRTNDHAESFETIMTKAGTTKPTSMWQLPLWSMKEAKRREAQLRTILAQHPCGLFTDIDGTISLTAPTVSDAVLLPNMRELLEEASHQFEVVATISGRSVEDQRRMINLPNIWHVGHHGYEWEELGPTGKKKTILYPEVEPYIAKVAAALDEIEEELAPKVQGLWMERKGITGGVHWRLAINEEEAERIAVPVIKRIARRYGLRTKGSKKAVELYPPISTNKGEGLRRIIKAHNIKGAFYFGDDVSDTDAFRELAKMKRQKECIGMSFGVVHHDTPEMIWKHADMLINGTENVARVIEWLINNQK